MGIADVDTYLNVRAHAGESYKIIGKMTRNTGCNIISEKNGWSKIESGNVKGYVKSEYLIKGEEAQKRALKVATLKAVVNTETLNVRFLRIHLFMTSYRKTRIIQLRRSILRKNLFLPIFPSIAARELFRM